jgi:hypothetical protein
MKGNATSQWLQAALGNTVFAQRCCHVQAPVTRRIPLRRSVGGHSTEAAVGYVRTTLDCRYVCGELRGLTIPYGTASIWHSYASASQLFRECIIASRALLNERPQQLIHARHWS